MINNNKIAYYLSVVCYLFCIFVAKTGSGDGEVDRTARSALNRLQSIPGLSADFLREFATLAVRMEPTAR